MAKNPRNYPDTLASSESGRPMMRGEKLVTFKIEGRAFEYKQPGWWCSLTDPDDMDGQLVDDDNQVAEMARRTAKALAHGEKVFVPVVIRAIRQRCGLTQREAGLLFGTGESRSKNTKAGDSTVRAHQAAAQAGDGKARTVQAAEDRRIESSSIDDSAFVHEALAAAHIERLYEPLFAEPR